MKTACPTYFFLILEGERGEVPYGFGTTFNFDLMKT